MGKDRRAQARTRSQPPDRREVQPEGEPNAGRSPAEAGTSEERRGLLAPFQTGQGDPPQPPVYGGEPPVYGSEPPVYGGKPPKSGSEPANTGDIQRGLPASCPIAPRVSQVLNLSSDLGRAMRRLRRELNACQACPAGEDCRFISYFQEQVNAAITQVNAEWGLA